jgi:hypothetical protein
MCGVLVGAGMDRLARLHRVATARFRTASALTDRFVAAEMSAWQGGALAGTRFEAVPGRLIATPSRRRSTSALEAHHLADLNRGANGAGVQAAVEA